MGKETKPIIMIVKKRNHVDHEEHNSAWKIAYADFMTAMMAFFLVMWLVSSMAPEKKKGIASYFDPIGANEGASGVGGVMGGRTLSTEGPLSQMTASMRLNPPLGAETPQEIAIGVHTPPADQGGQPGEQKEQLMPEDKAFAETQEKLQEALESKPELKEFLAFVKITNVTEGLQIDLIENYRKPMFLMGGRHVSPELEHLLDAVADVLKALPNAISIVGHTDARAYRGLDYTNWELSADRANATRRYLVEQAPELRFESVIGRADTEPYLPQDPTSPLNRRIRIIVLKNKPVPHTSEPNRF